MGSFFAAGDVRKTVAMDVIKAVDKKAAGIRKVLKSAQKVQKASKHYPKTCHLSYSLVEEGIKPFAYIGYLGLLVKDCLMIAMFCKTLRRK